MYLSKLINQLPTLSASDSYYYVPNISNETTIQLSFENAVIRFGEGQKWDILPSFKDEIQQTIRHFVSSTEKKCEDSMSRSYCWDSRILAQNFMFINENYLLNFFQKSFISSRQYI